PVYTTSYTLSLHDALPIFRREARAMSQLTHPNTVKVFMYGQLNEGQGAGSLYIVMEYLDGRNLNRAVKREGPLSVERATTILIQDRKSTRLNSSHVKISYA